MTHPYKAIIEEACDNTANYHDFNKLGLLKFLKRFFPARFRHNYSNVHYLMVKLFLKLHDPTRLFVMDKQAYFLVHRDAAKSTFGSFGIPIYSIYLNGYSIYTTTNMLDWDAEHCEKHKDLIIGKNIVEIKMDESFIVIASQTARRAETWVSDIKYAIEKHNALNKIFGEKDPRVISESDERSKSHKMWRINQFITADQTVVTAIGAGQHTRGLNIGGSRPTFIVVDDMYSGENTRTQETRDKLAYWFHAELINSSDSQRGKILALGTIVHQDTVFKEITKSPQWFGIERPIISLTDLDHMLNRIKNAQGEIVRPNYEECLKFDEEYKSLSWKESKGTYFIISKFMEMMEKKSLNSFYQEWMNIPLDPNAKAIKPDTFHQLEMNWYQKDNKQLVEFDYEGLKWKGRANLYLGLDPASSVSNTSDDTAIVIAGFIRAYPIYPGYDDIRFKTEMPTGKVFPCIAHVEGGKYSIHNYDNMKGMCESLLNLDYKFILEYANIEANGQQMHIVREIRDYFREKNRRTNIWDEYNMGQKKGDRILSIILPIAQRYDKILCCQDPLVDKIYNQLLTVNIADHDDYADAYSIAMKNISIPDDYMMVEQTYNNNVSLDRWQKAVKEHGTDAWYYY